jgi:hypothetical protein
MINAARTAQQTKARTGSVLSSDARVVSTAIAHQSDVLVTTDRAWPAKRLLGYDSQLIQL